MRQKIFKSEKWKPGKLAYLFVPVFLILVFSIYGKAQNASPKELSLHDVQKFAISNSFESKKTQLDVLAAKKKLKETIASGLPQISSSFGYINNLELTTMLIPNFFDGKLDEKIAVQFGTQHNLNANLTVSQLLFNGSYIVGLQTTSIYKILAAQSHEMTKMNVLETVTNTYFLILVLEENEKILTQSLANLKKTHNEIKERFNEGFVAETDVDLIQISVTKIKNNLQSVKRNKEVGYRLLKFQMGWDYNIPLILTDNLDGILSDINVKETAETEFDLAKSIDFKLVNSQEKLSKMALKNEKAKYLPTVTAFYTFQLSAMRDAFDFFSPKERWFRTQMLGVNINVPIFKSGMQSARVQQAAISFKQAQNAKKQISQGLLLEVSRAKSNLDSAYENYLNTNDNLKLSKKVYNVNLIKYKEGVASSLDLTQAHNQFLLSQSEYIQALSGLLGAKNKLDRLNNNYEKFE